jgi:hypothetical protein
MREELRLLQLRWLMLLSLLAIVVLGMQRRLLLKELMLLLVMLLQSRVVVLLRQVKLRLLPLVFLAGLLAGRVVRHVGWGRDRLSRACLLVELGLRQALLADAAILVHKFQAEHVVTRLA